MKTNIKKINLIYQIIFGTYKGIFLKFLTFLIYKKLFDKAIIKYYIININIIVIYLII